MLVSIVTGTRPQIIKSAPVIHAMRQQGVDYEFVHTGQHYDFELAQSFVNDFDLSKPFNLHVGSGDYCYQVYSTIERLSDHYQKNRPDIMIVPGDTTSALGASMVGFKMEIPVCHLESGLRRYDLTVQEELNRRLIDHGSSALFAPTPTAAENLELERVQGEVYMLGDTMYDVLKNRMKIFLDPPFQEEVLSKYNVSTGDYAIMTFHRREHVDVKSNLEQIVNAINQLEFPIILAMHPRTKKNLIDAHLELKSPNLRVVAPLPYDEFMCLMANAGLAISDSGGIQKESYILGTPLVSLHNCTEWVETLKYGKHRLGELKTDRILNDCKDLFGKRYESDPSVYGDGKSAEKILPILLSGEVKIPTKLRY
ncbi:MAG: UDP-N-acetylglucosamine 2-epimerase (non-hydrolyzing) [Candidatus Thorarchaeota archaeon]|nr:UDP-N-acetylglucosamine 2-epimerase (non-hydrolyzing) [Candidatus Thorarchaeota archaeon]